MLSGKADNRLYWLQTLQQRKLAHAPQRGCHLFRWRSHPRNAVSRPMLSGKAANLLSWYQALQRRKLAHAHQRGCQVRTEV